MARLDFDPETDVAHTKRERAAIDRLHRLAKTWPKSLTLFSWSGSLVVIRTDDYAGSPDEMREAMNAGRIEYVEGITNDGGDP